MPVYGGFHTQMDGVRENPTKMHDLGVPPISGNPPHVHDIPKSLGTSKQGGLDHSPPPWSLGALAQLRSKVLTNRAGSYPPEKMEL